MHSPTIDECKTTGSSGAESLICSSRQIQGGIAFEPSVQHIYSVRSAPMSFSSSSIANSARRVRERRRMELELLQQKQQQQVPLLAPRSPGSSSAKTSVSRQSKSPKSPNNHLPLSDMEPISTIRDGSRSISPQSMMMSMSSVPGSFGSPPGSPRLQNEVPTTATSNSHGSSSSRPIFLHRRPPMVSPSSPQQKSRSWDEGDSYRPPSPSIRSTSPLPSWTLQPKLQPPNQFSSSSPQRKLQPRTNNHPRIVAELGNFPVMPSKSTKSNYSFRRVNSSPTVGTDSISYTSKNVDTDTTNTTGNQTAESHDTEYLSKSNSMQQSSSGEDESSLGGKDESKNTSPALSSVSSYDSNPTNSSIRLLCQAIQGTGSRPVHLSLEEKALWDTMQSVRQQAYQEGIQLAKKELLSTNGLYQRNSSPQSVDTSWDVGFVELQEQAVSQQRDNSRSLQAIQRILSDVQAERDQAVLRIQDYRHHDNDSVVGASSTKMLDPVTEKEAMHRDLLAMSEHIVSLEHELLNNHVEPEVKVTVEPYDGNGSEFEVIIERLEQENEALVEKIEWKDMVIEQLEKQVESVKVRRGTMDSIDSAASVMSETQTNHFQIGELRKELSEKSATLENAKMIIASLENASGSLAADLKRKLRERDDDLKTLQKELSEKQRTLDTLATELRDVQNAAAIAVPLQNTEAAQVKRLQLSSRLETNLAEIRAAAVILESTQDATAASNLSELLSDSASALRDGIDVIENGLPDERRGPLRLHRELEEKDVALKNLEDKLRAQKSEASRYRKTSEDMLRRRDEEISALHAEIKILRQQCTTNMEVLTRKERELAVLRDSLRVDDDGVGYISDDDEADEDDQNAESAPASKSIHHLSVDYGPSQAEALATLLSHANANHSFDSGLNRDRTAAMQAAAVAAAQSTTSHEELESLKAELNTARTESEKAHRQLLVEKESLSNAKMIISSLERASKTMMEDLRARLQDSNTAIASLLEKSMESEKTSARLRSELDTVKRSHYCSNEPDEETHLMLAPAPQPLLLTETID